MTSRYLSLAAMVLSLMGGTEAVQAAEFGPHQITLSYTPMVQRAVRSKDTNANGELDLIGTLQLAPGGAGAMGQTRLAFWGLGNHTIGGTTPTGNFSRGAGLLWDTNDGDAGTTPEWALGVFALQQDIHTGAGIVTLELGKLYSGNNLAALDYAGDDRDSFLSQSIASDVAGRWYDRIGLGLSAAIEGQGWFAQALYNDATAADPAFDFNTLKDGSNLLAAEVGLRPQIAGRDSRVSVMPYLVTSSADFTRETGVVLAASHDLVDGGEGEAPMVLFGRYTYRTGGEPLTADGRADAKTAKHGGFIGMAFNEPFGRAAQQIGVAAMYGAASATARANGFGSQSGLEAYWKTGLGKHLEFTADLQMIHRGGAGVEYIPGLRLKLVF